MCVADVIVTHAIMTRHQEIPGFWRLFVIQSSYIMHILFFISGYLLYGSINRSGVREFIKRKFIRLGIPILAFSPISFFYSEPIGALYFWYTETLLIFSVAYAIFWKFFPYTDNENKSTLNLFYIVICAISLGIICSYIRHTYPFGRWIHWTILSIEPAHIFQYILMIIMGIVFQRNNWLSEMKREIKWIIIIIGGIAMLGVARLPLQPTKMWFCIVESFCVIFFSLGTILCCRTHFHLSGRVKDWLSDNSYGAYVLHGICLLSVNYILELYNFNTYLHVSLLILPALVFSFSLSHFLRKISCVRKVL